jgi:beta-lactam-binding protein with PASTA domain
VQDAVGARLAAAKQAMARSHCRLGRIRRAYSKHVNKGRVISQKPKFGAVRSGGAKVNLVVSLGRKG